ncbi:hypothetical protein [Methylophaga sp.]|uniref:hypothetical protein n=1 Tax=Methylophaga sp. TaxID=2024840 RepID=UPI003A94F4C4
MFFIATGLLAKFEMGSVCAVCEQWIISGFLRHNLIPMTLVNMLGGSVFVGLFYWFIYLTQIIRKYYD